MDDLTNRQTDILKALIREYTESGEAIGSEMLEKKYRLGFSPATIRNEMVVLEKKGYLVKEYFSAGRIPSARAFRFYINHLMKEKHLSTGDEVAYKHGIWDERRNSQKLMAHAVKLLAHKTGLLAVATTNTGDLFYAGVGNLLALQEFSDWSLTRSLYARLDELAFWAKVLEQADQVEGDIYIMLGEEDFRDPVYESCASILGHFRSPHINGMIGVVGPKRMNYDGLTPQIRYFSNLIGQIMTDTQKA
jgi:heat-inducible transcriptional repressor